jgi:hypothetical protein
MQKRDAAIITYHHTVAIDLLLDLEPLGSGEIEGVALIGVLVHHQVALLADDAVDIVQVLAAEETLAIDDEHVAVGPLHS